jgi:hypothetical protein
MIEVVSILDSESFRVLFDGAHIMAVDVIDEKRYTQFQVENGTSRSDHSVKLPIIINMPMLITEETRATFENLRQAFLNDQILIVQTRVASYESMVIEAMPHTETVDNLLGVQVNIRFVEWRTVTPVYGDFPLGTTRNPAQSSTVPRGQQQTADASGAEGAEARRKGSVLAGVFN